MVGDDGAMSRTIWVAGIDRLADLGETRARAAEVRNALDAGEL